MTRRQIVDFCLTFPDAYEDYPFDTDQRDPKAWTVMRHRENRKSFALLFERDGTLFLNVKCEPEEARFLRKVYSYVIPAYHMNKEHWNSILVMEHVPRNEITGWIRQSYELTRPASRQKSLDKKHG